MSSSVFKESPELKNIIDTAMYFIVISGFIGPKFKKSGYDIENRNGEFEF